MPANKVQDLAVRETPTDVITWDDVEVPDEFCENDPGRFPSLQIIQKPVESIPNSRQHGGDFWRSDLEEFAEQIEGTFLAYQPTRALFQKMGVGDGRPICHSEDGIKPVPGQPVWSMERITLRDQGEIAGGAVFDEPATCAACPFRTNGCKFSYVSYLLDDDGYLLRMRFKGTGVMAFANFLRTLRPKALRVGSKMKGRPIFSKRIRLTTVNRTKDDFTWFEPQIEVLGDTNPRHNEQFMGYARIVRTRISQGFEPLVEEEMDDDATGAGTKADDGWEDGRTWNGVADVPLD